jgi:hypothetical protein
MRELLNLLSVIQEDESNDKAKTLSPGVLLKRPGRFDSFIQHIATNQPFLSKEGHQVIIDPKEARRIQSLHNSPGGTKFKGAIELKTIDGDYIPLSSLLKTSEFGGQLSGSATDDPNQEGGPIKGKAGFQLNPAQIKITDKDINAEDFGDMITHNQVLESTDYGKVTIQLAYEIMSGEGAVLPEDYRDKDHEVVRTALVDNAGEYLGVLALLYGQSSFPKRKQFEEWLGGSLGDLVLRFPSKQNEKLADSYAEVKNAATSHTVKISSKGTGGGAPPSMTGLKIPDHIRKNKKYAALVEFIEMTKTTPTKEQPFRGMNIIHKYNPKAIPRKFNQFLPWTDKVMQQAEQSLSLFKANRTQESMLPAKYQTLWADMGFKGASSDGGKLMYLVKKAVVDMVNNNDAIPNYQGGVLEILDMNFMQQYATYKAGKIVFTTQWPAKLDGKVTLESKSGSTDPTKGGFSFKLADTAEHDSVDMYGDDSIAQDELAGDDALGTNSLAKAAKNIVNPVRKEKETSARTKRK